VKRREMYLEATPGEKNLGRDSISIWKACFLN
jgi:hypothetical protein